MEISRPPLNEEEARRILIVAGEASGDLHGSNLVRALKRYDPGITVSGIGGTHMKQAGVEILVSASEMAVVGLTEVFFRLGVILKARHKIRNLLKSIPSPDLLILIDYPDFNIHLASLAKRWKIPVLYYISPQVWAWRKGRIKKLAKRVDRMAVILPFEEDLYRNKGVDVTYVGHPLLDVISEHSIREDAIGRLDLQKASPVIGLLPGSRQEEIENTLPFMLKAVEILSSRYSQLQCVLPVAPTVSVDLVQSFLAESNTVIHISDLDIYSTLRACDLALVASGTATLETAIMEVPMIVVYRVSPMTYWIGRKLVNVPYISLVNLVAGKLIVPELIQDAFNPEKLAEEAFRILEDRQEREDMIRHLKAVKHRLGERGASERTARLAIEMMGRL
ncbi:MAG: lipid-A-disaccharide synthase [Deltaproteobacteria bacterium]|nr:lipid-A-disaccharide synthase [Deltaproteobacteria bacterium]